MEICYNDSSFFFRSFVSKVLIQRKWNSFSLLSNTWMKEKQITVE